MSNNISANQVHFLFTAGGEDFGVLGFQSYEAISSLYSVELRLTSENSEIDFEQMIGQSAALTSSLLEQGVERYTHGIINRFEQCEQRDRFTVYRATLVPAFWYLTQRINCRIFQNKSAKDITEDILREMLPDLNFEFRGVNVATRIYCVQYRESDFNFISRLLEEEGVFYFFEHSQSEYKLVFGHDSSAHLPTPNNEDISFHSAVSGQVVQEHIKQFFYSEQICSGKVNLRDFNFKQFHLKPEGENQTTLNSELEVYDYPGIFQDSGLGNKLANVRLEECQVKRKIVKGSSICVSLTSGHYFNLEDHPRDNFNQRYLLTKLRLEVQQPQVLQEEGSGSKAEWIFDSQFEAIPFDVPFRPARVTPKPLIKGSQTAEVTTSNGGEIYSDSEGYGQVKVLFHWDREGKRGQDNTCWIRVSQPWAGKGWGGVNVPREGQEVVVDFLEGDPDRPIIIGKTYNSSAMPPYKLPLQGVISGLKSSSTKRVPPPKQQKATVHEQGAEYNATNFNYQGNNYIQDVHPAEYKITPFNPEEQPHIIAGIFPKFSEIAQTFFNGLTGKSLMAPFVNLASSALSRIYGESTNSMGGYNEISMNDTRSNELIRINAQYNMDMSVGYDLDERIFHNRTSYVQNDENIAIINNRSKYVHANQTENIGVNKSIQVGGTHSEIVDGFNEIHTRKDLINQTDLDRQNYIKEDSICRVDEDKHQTVMGDEISYVDGDQSEIVKGDVHQYVDGDFLHQTAHDISLLSDLIVIDSNDITLKAGGSFIRINSSGVTIKGATIDLNSGATSAGDSTKSKTKEPKQPKALEGDDPSAPENPASAGEGTSLLNAKNTEYKLSQKKGYEFKGKDALSIGIKEGYTDPSAKNENKLSLGIENKFYDESVVHIGSKDNNIKLLHTEGSNSHGYSRNLDTGENELSVVKLNGKFTTIEGKAKGDALNGLLGANAHVEAFSIAGELTPLAVNWSEDKVAIKSEAGVEANLIKGSAGGQINITPKTMYDNTLGTVFGCFDSTADWKSAPDYMDHGVILGGQLEAGIGAAAKAHAKAEAGKDGAFVELGAKLGFGPMGGFKAILGVK